MKHTESSYLSIAIEAVEEASKIVRDACQSSTRSATEKADRSYVTQTDIASERAIVEVLSRHTPGFGIYSEEETAGPRRRKDYTWIVDPIDGTHNFHYGFPCFAIQIALEHKGEIIAAVISLPAEDTIVYAERGGGCFANGERVHVSPRPLRSGLLILETRWTPIDKKILATFESVAHDIRVINSSCTSIAYVAMGRADALIDWDDKPWDLAAGSLLVREAGGRVTNLAGCRFDVYRPECIATNGTTHDDVVSLLRESKAFPPKVALCDAIT